MAAQFQETLYFHNVNKILAEYIQKSSILIKIMSVTKNEFLCEYISEIFPTLRDVIFRVTRIVPSTFSYGRF